MPDEEASIFVGREGGRRERLEWAEALVLGEWRFTGQDLDKKSEKREWDLE